MPVMQPDLMPPSSVSLVIDGVELWVLLEGSIRQALRDPGFLTCCVIELMYRHAPKLDRGHVDALVELIECTANESYTKRYRRSIEQSTRQQWRELVAWLRKNGHASPPRKNL